MLSCFGDHAWKVILPGLRRHRYVIVWFGYVADWSTESRMSLLRQHQHLLSFCCVSCVGMPSLFESRSETTPTPSFLSGEPPGTSLICYGICYGIFMFLLSFGFICLEAIIYGFIHVWKYVCLEIFSLLRMPRLRNGFMFGFILVF